MTLPNGFTLRRFETKRGPVDVPVSVWKYDKHGKPLVIELHCPYCSYTKSKVKDFQEHLDNDIHLYGFRKGVNPFTGEMFVPMIEGLPAEEALEILEAEG